MSDKRPIEMVDRRVAAILRQKTPAERVLMGLECNEAARTILACQLKSRYPQWSDAEVQAEVARRMLGDAARPSPLNH